MFSYQFNLSSNLNHSIQMSDDQVMAKIQSWSLKKRTEKLPEQSSTLNAFMSPNGSEFGLTYFKEICSPISQFIQNLNHSIRMSDDQVMAKIQL